MKKNLSRLLANFYGTEFYHNDNLNEENKEVLYTDGILELNNIINNDKLFNNIINGMYNGYQAHKDKGIMFGVLKIHDGNVSLNIYDDLDGMINYNINFIDKLEDFADCELKLFIQDNIICLLSEY